ncbi:DUF6332 family protein [Streptomyces rhizosphaerihabitans]|uniref:DUF6332 family protein n=1 Tax=Streptomyces rhizosphaerihabitans TaxID=1266770 RepID=UPI0021C0DA5C|nr:DUF6332 family protein [Streptomyces rhizosphaerihabitans]MCT9004583.1 DUF6332 family protein [Streptomyces rhizosphaerihabitans]
MSNNGESLDSCRASADGTHAQHAQARRDAVTVEIGYALASAVFVAAVAFGVVTGPALFLDLSSGAVRALETSGGALAALLFALRVATVLFRFRHETAPQPSQPGRTNPDS